MREDRSAHRRQGNGREKSAEMSSHPRSRMCRAQQKRQKHRGGGGIGEGSESMARVMRGVTFATCEIPKAQTLHLMFSSRSPGARFTHKAA